MVTEEQDQTTKKRQVPKFSPATTMPEDLVENAPEQAKAVLKFCDVKARTVESTAKIHVRFNKSQIDELAQYLGLDILQKPQRFGSPVRTENQVLSGSINLW